MGKLLFRHFIFSAIASCLTLSAFGQKHPVYPTIPPPPHTPQEILLLFSGNTADERILLTLNNNRPDVMTTSVTVYTSAGVSTALPDVQMIPQESKLIELSPLLQAAGLGHQELGWIKLNYSGVTLEMGAQLTLYPEKNGSGVDSPRSLSSDFKSTERDAVFWLPEGGKARLALGNSSVGSISVKMKCSTDTEELVIPAKTTKIRYLEPPNVGPILHAGKVPFACEIASDGPIDALRPIGTVVAPDYSAPIRFYDPKTATSSSLTAVGLETTAETHVTVHNVSDAPIEFVPILREAALTNPQTQTLPSRVLAPHGSVELNIDSLLAALQAQGISRATLTLKTAAPKGAFIGAVTQISSPDRLVEDIPLRTSNPPAFARGSYPLRWDEDYTNLVTVTNTAEGTLRIGGQITTGDVTYVFKRTDIDPGATIVFDVDKWKRDAVPDVNGKTIPKDAPYGKFHWIEMSYGKKAGLLGRTSLTSVKNRRKSSFSCGSTCQYETQRYPYFDPQLPAALSLGDNQVSQITEYDVTANGSPYTYPITYWGGAVTSDSPSIISIGPDSSTLTNIIEYGNAQGTANVSWVLSDTEYYYDPDSDTCDTIQNSQTPQGGQTTVQTPGKLFVQSDTSSTVNCPVSVSTQRVITYQINDTTGTPMYTSVQIRENVPVTTSSCNNSIVHTGQACFLNSSAEPGGLNNFNDNIFPGCPTSVDVTPCGFQFTNQQWQWCSPSGSQQSIGTIGPVNAQNTLITVDGNFLGLTGITFGP